MADQYSQRWETRPKFKNKIKKFLLEGITSQQGGKEGQVWLRLGAWEACTSMLTAALFATAKKWQQPKCPSKVEGKI